MEVWLNNLINWIPVGGLYYFIIGFLCFVDAIAFIGILYPGGFLVVVSGFLAANGKGDIATLALVSAVGSFAGDFLSYILGARAGGAIMRRPWFKRRENLLQKAQLYFAAHGGKSVFVGRFVGFLRPFIPFIAGSARMNPIAFTLYALISAITWGIVNPGLGYFFGASWQMVQVWSGRFSLLVLLLLALFLLNALFWRYLLPVLNIMLRRMTARIVSRWRTVLNSRLCRSFASTYPRFWNFLRNRFDTEHVRGSFLTTGFIISSLFLALLLWFGRSIHISGPLTDFDQRLNEVLAILHHPWTDLFFAAVSWIGSGEAMALIGGLALFILIIHNRDFSALIFILGMSGGELFAFLIKGIFHRPHPSPLFPDLQIAASSPSLHAFSALLLYGLISYFLLEATRNSRIGRIALFLCSSFIILLIGFSRIYLGIDWCSDVLAGLLLAALWLTFLITLCETRFRFGNFGIQRGCRPFTLSPQRRLLLIVTASMVTLVLLIVFITPYLHTLSLGRSVRLHQNLEFSEISVNLPRTTENLWGEPLRPLTLIVLADEETLQSRLTAAGWQLAGQSPLRGFKTLLIDLLQGRQPAGATIIPQLVAGQSQDLSLVRSNELTNDSRLQSLLVWDLNRRLPDGRTVWGLLLSQQIGVKHLSLLPIPLPLTAPCGSEDEAELNALFSAVEGDISPRILFYGDKLPPLYKEKR